MTMYQQYYLENLYPLQAAIIQIVNGRTDPFYLTGGTALSRGYLNHRYSANLVFFTNNNPSFIKACDSALKGLKGEGFKIKDDASNLPYFIRKIIFAKGMSNPISIQVDFINDIAVHFGGIINHPSLGRLDNLQNILTNKLCAVLERNEARDVIDIWAICKKLDFSWADILREADMKSESIDSRNISGTILSLPEKEFDNIKWVSKPLFKDFQNDIETIVRDMDTLGRNSIA